MPTVIPTIIVHGGAWAIPLSQTEATKHGVAKAVCTGYRLLRNGNSALQAVEAAVRVLEDDPVFDAGRGSCLNEAGQIEMDSVIMTDSQNGCTVGAVAALSCARHPVSVARAVAEQTPHCLLVGEGADSFARQVMSKDEIIHSIDQLVTKQGIEEWNRFKQYPGVVNELFRSGKQQSHDTVGAVALDEKGILACATSTGGITYKRVGRVGDSPLVGCGLFCQMDIGACSTTGHGESIIKVTLARLAIALMEFGGLSGQAAVDQALKRMWEKTSGCGGIVLLDKNGRPAWAFSTERMAWATVDHDGKVWVGIDKDEKVLVHNDGVNALDQWDTINLGLK